MSDRRERELERRFKLGDDDAGDKLGVLRCRRGIHDDIPYVALSTRAFGHDHTVVECRWCQRPQLRSDVRQGLYELGSTNLFVVESAEEARRQRLLVQLWTELLAESRRKNPWLSVTDVMDARPPSFPHLHVHEYEEGS